MNKVMQRLITLFTTLESHPQGLSATELAQMTGYPTGLILDDLNQISLYTHLGSHFLIYPDDPADGPDESKCSQAMDDPVDYWVQDPQIKWNLTITTDPYPTLGLTLQEAITLWWLFTEYPPPKELKKLLNQLMIKLLSGDEMAVAKEASKNLHTRGGITFTKSPYLDQLRAAVLADLKIELQYYARNIHQQVNWLLWPLGLIFHTGNATWYLVAKREENHELVVCHLDRVRGLKVLNEKFVYPEEFSLGHYLRQRWGMDMSPGETVRVRFYNEANVVQKVQKQFKIRGLAQPKKLADGSLEYHGEIYGIYNFAKWVLSFGSSAEVLEPKWLRDEMIRIAKLWCDWYKDRG